MRDAMTFRLIDDGTLDTVFRDNDGRELRYNFINSGFDDYEDFVDWCLEDIEHSEPDITS